MAGRRILAIALFLAVVTALAGAVAFAAFSRDVARLTERGRAETSLAADRLVAQLLRFRLIGAFLSDHPTVLGHLTAPPADRAALDRLLLRLSDVSGSLDIHLLAADGSVVGGSGETARLEPGSGAEVQRALTGALGLGHGIDPETGQRVFTYASPVFSPEGPVLGAIVVRIDAAAVETAWRGEPQTIFFTDDSQTIFISNRDELLLRSAAGGDGTASFGPQDTFTVAGQTLWRLDAGPYIPSLAVHLTQPLPVIDMTAETLVTVLPAIRQALLQGAAAGTLGIGFGAVLLALAERRRALAVKLAAEAAANAQLEQRVALRTQELSDANEQLRRAQADLVQAGKLSALGQMSAGISHELNQPLMAIQTYAGNARQFLERGKTDVVGQNLSQIAELSRRMGRIIRNLRAFARQESVPVSTVELGAVVDAALELSEPKLRAGGVTVDWTRPPGAVLVRGGEVRLQQVVLNLITNAADAMETSAERRLALSVAHMGDRVILTVADTGPGISEPEKIFEPFYSTKAVGHEDGMGLGLSISYGLIQSFGGKISGANRPEGGAEFSVELTAAEEAEAA